MTMFRWLGILFVSLSQSLSLYNDGNNDNQYGLPEWGNNWCKTPDIPPLPYQHCNASDTINIITLDGGMTNALKFVLLGSILSFEENRCFYVDESRSHINNLRRGFINQYFEPIGMQQNDIIIQNAYKSGRIKHRHWRELWEKLRRRRLYETVHNITSLYMENVEGHRLKRIMLRRMWRLKESYRDKVCSALNDFALGDEYMAFSVRRGDKYHEKRTRIANMGEYLDAAQHAINARFGGVVPTIFVASDDCRVMKVLRKAKPTWRFVSLCDEQMQTGFDLLDMKNWSPEATEAHYLKFFIELFALASSTYYIGVAYTNVAWWTFFMRETRHNFRLLDAKNQCDDCIFNLW